MPLHGVSDFTLQLRDSQAPAFVVVVSGYHENTPSQPLPHSIMGYWLLNSLLIFCLCVLLSGFLIPQILLIAYRRNLFDEVDERKIHKGHVPRLGGIGFVPVICVSVATALVINYLLGYTAFTDAFSSFYLSLLCVFISLELLFLVGIADDLIGVKYRAKFVVQIICFIILICGGVWFRDFGGVLGINFLPLWFSYPFSVLVVVFLINAINLIDGIDGLASGLSSIVCIIYGFSFLMLGRYASAMLAFAQLGVLVPFFYYNVFGNVERHSKIFMGDTGALTVGLLLAVLGIKLYNCDDESVVGINSAIVAFSPLIVPCFDVIRVYMVRIRQHHSPFLPDKNHIHHKLLAAGLKPRMAMITIVSVSLLFCALNFVLSMLLNFNINIIIIIDVVIWVLANMWLSRRIRLRRERGIID